MPIDDSALKRNFRVFDPQTTLEQVFEQVGMEEKLYIVVGLTSGQYASMSLSELRKGLEGLQTLQDRTMMLNAPLGDLLEPFAADPVEQASMSTNQATRSLRRVPGRRLVVVADGQVVGLLTEKIRTLRGAPPPSPKGLVLSAGDEPQAEAEPAKRINVELKDQDDARHDPKAKPLQADQIYTLVFDVDEKARPTSLVTDAFFKYKFKSDEQEVTITVQLESDDFKILTKPQEILVPRTGRSNKARFDIRAEQEGPGVINALFFKDGNFIQVLTLKFTVVGEDGALFSEAELGRSMDAAFAVQPRDLNLTILDTGSAFQLVMSGPVAAMATLPITREYLAHKITEARKVLQEEVVFMTGAGGSFVYQEGIDIPLEANQLALKHLADVGYGLFYDIFYSDDADLQANRMGDKLREMAQGEETLNIQIFSQHFMLPWGILYMADEDQYDPDNVDPELFLGLRHIIEHIPLQPSMHVTDNKIESRAGLTVGVNVNTDIDEQMGAPLVAEQLDYWGARHGSGVQVIQRDTVDELKDALKNTQTTNDQILYFYCHAVSKDLEEDGPDTSVIILSGHERLTLKELKRLASTRKILPGQPLVYINACESAELSPLFYDGFVPYFMAKGARGVIGTECETPALFAVEWSKRFFDRFLAGEPLGKIFLDLRREFYQDHNNLLGLLYSLYVDGDTQVVPGLQAV